MKTYEIVIKLSNPCAGAGRPQTFFEEAELEDPADYIRRKHGKDLDRFTKTVLPSGQLLYSWDNGGVSYRYEFTAY